MHAVIDEDKARKEVLRTVEGDLLSGKVIKPTVYYGVTTEGVLDCDHPDDLRVHLKSIARERVNVEGFDLVAYVDRKPASVRDYLARVKESDQVDVMTFAENDVDVYLVTLKIEVGIIKQVFSCVVCDFDGNRSMTELEPVQSEEKRFVIRERLAPTHYHFQFREDPISG